MMKTDSRLVDHQTFVLDGRRVIEIAPPIAGIYHVFVYGYEPVALLVADESGQELGRESERASAFVNVEGDPMLGASSVARLRAASSYEATLKGRGCVLVATFWEFSE